MVNEEILGGLRSALARGQPIQKAKLSFFNAGYSKQEIEEAARALQSGTPQQPAQQPQQPRQRPQQLQNQQPKNQEEEATSLYKKEEGGQKITQFQPQQNQQAQQQGQVSNYEGFDRSGQVITIILVTLLILLIGILTSIFFFREQLVQFFGGLFG